jgi:hypothetical protein
VREYLLVALLFLKNVHGPRVFVCHQGSKARFRWSQSNVIANAKEDFEMCLPPFYGSDRAGLAGCTNRD